MCDHAKTILLPLLGGSKIPPGVRKRASQRPPHKAMRPDDTYHRVLKELANVIAKLFFLSEKLWLSGTVSGW